MSEGKRGGEVEEKISVGGGNYIGGEGGYERRLGRVRREEREGRGGRGQRRKMIEKRGNSD